MARFMQTFETPTALSGTAPVSAGAANGLIASLQASSTCGYKLRRLTLGVRAGASVPTSQQLTIAFARSTVRGTQGANNAGNKMDPNTAASQITGLDTGHTTVAPTATYTAPYFYEVSFNSQSGVDLPFELLEEWVVAAGTGNGLVCWNVGNALPASHLYTCSFEWEE